MAEQGTTGFRKTNTLQMILCYLGIMGGAKRVHLNGQNEFIQQGDYLTMLCRSAKIIFSLMALERVIVNVGLILPPRMKALRGQGFMPVVITCYVLVTVRIHHSVSSF